MSLKRTPKFPYSLIAACAFVTLIIIFLYQITSEEEIIEEITFETIETVTRYTDSELQRINGAKKCWQLQNNDTEIEFLEDILESDKQPELGKSIFFHITSCSTAGRVELLARQACAIESAAKWNPKRDIYVLFTSPVGLVSNDSIIDALLSYPNIHFRNLNPYTYSTGTPAEDWFKTDEIFLSRFPVAHMADYLRFLTLFRYGGVYSDLDVVFLKNLDDLPPNFSGAESTIDVAIGVMGFEEKDVGHKIIEMIVRDNINHYDPNAWSNAGPGSITRVLKQICHRNRVPDLEPEYCWGFKVFPPKTFYAIHWRKWEMFFDANPDVINAVMNMTKDSVAIHLWNRLSVKKQVVKSEPKIVYGFVAENNCPKAFEASGPYF